MAPEHLLTLVARLGYASRGIVYLLIGGLATLAAVDQGGKTTGSKGALAQLLTAPMGNVLLGTLALGLISYALWRCVQAFTDTDHHGKSPKGLTIRTSLAISAITHMLLAVFAIKLVLTLGGNDSSGGGSANTASWLMTQPYGRWLVGAVGLVMISAGVAHGVKGARAQFDRHFDMPHNTQRWAYPICRFGLMSRGLVFMVTGTFFLMAAYHLNPEEAGGIAEVFDTFRQQPFGTPLMALVAVGLFAFGTYSILEAFYRCVNPASEPE
ncbi:DUF1206 domain-containing protein [Marinobacter sp. 1-4A]|uniref:DUF1206 domain-containing protein n=1 Tax=unclassified Marinobacter TaxID=83889 RepID=UPI001905D7CB|nr:DUF1206 domain-containing protein [Marinobacter sp. 1-4A]MBK1853054.1 DUF1206 domain-containing protein [Marinobacter sp. 1-4A]